MRKVMSKREKSGMVSLFKLFWGVLVAIECENNV